MHNVETGYMDVEYRTYEYDKEKGIEKEHINIWYRKDEFILAFEISHMMCKKGKKVINHFK